MSENQNTFMEVLSANMGKREVDWLCNEAVLNRDTFRLFFQLMFREDTKTAWHSCWVLEKVSRKAPELFQEDQIKILVDFTLTNRHDGIQRLCLSILFNLPLYQPISVEFINNCFERMMSPKETVGVQVLSMKMLGRICDAEPEFIPELISCLENTDAELYSKGYTSAKRNMLKKLKMSMRHFRELN